MRSPMMLLLTAVFMAGLLLPFHTEAAESGDGGSVADHFQDDSPSESKSQQKQSEDENSQIASTSGTVWMFVKVLLVLAVVIALIYFLLRFVNARTKSYSQGRAIQNVGGVSVGSNRSVQLVKVGERVFVVGVGESVSLLKEIDDKGELSKLLEDNRHEDVIDQSIWKFRDWLKKTQTPENRGANFKQMLEGRLQQMKQERKKTTEQLHKKGPGK